MLSAPNQWCDVKTPPAKFKDSPPHCPPFTETFVSVLPDSHVSVSLPIQTAFPFCPPHALFVSAMLSTPYLPSEGSCPVPGVSLFTLKTPFPALPLLLTSANDIPRAALTTSLPRGPCSPQTACPLSPGSSIFPHCPSSPTPGPLPVDANPWVGFLSPPPFFFHFFYCGKIHTAYDLLS